MRKWTFAHVTLMAALLAGACGDDDDRRRRRDAAVDAGPDAGAQAARIRAIHLSPDAPEVDVFVNQANTAAIEGLEFTGTSTYQELAPGTYRFDVAPAGTSLSESVLTVRNVTLEPGGAYTVAVFNVLESIQASLIRDDLSQIPEGQVRVRPVHTAAGIGEVDVFEVTDPGAPVLLSENLAFGAAGDALEVESAPRVLGFDVNDDGLMDASFEFPEVDDQILINVYAVAEGEQVFTVAQTPGPTTTRIDPREPTGFARVLHMSPNAPAVDVFVDGGDEPALSGLEFTESSGFLSLAADTYNVRVAATGDRPRDAVLSVDDLEIEDGAFTTVVAFDRVEKITALAIPENYASLPAGQARVRGVHVAPAVGEVDVLNIPESGDPSILIENLGFATASEPLDIPEGDYTIGLDVNDDLEPDARFDVTAQAGQFVNLLAVNDTAEPPNVSLVAQFRDGTTAQLTGTQ
jgi:hypothetical protein